ncbi:cytochrome P450 6a2-like [Bombus affinis]|uniref:cytochrome P450 6a2-like n=1 Tax=Bombus affinis TaxID=309941 RepID=UPI0021B75980|nr:cytochrome P450 6a2-like [Bombus affinis]XP_050591729.1 cytochrome P450 6a2-like [Bombus affinis]
MDYFQLVCAIGMVLLAIYYYYTSNFDYWKIRGIPGPQPTVLIGNFKEILLRKTSLGDKLRDMYEEYKKEPMFGIFEGMTPILVINDLELIKDVLIKDFPLFVNRGFRLFKKAEPLGEHLFALEAERWRPMRAKLSPVFTSGKLREMFPLVIECSKNLEKYLDGVSQTGKPVECRDLAGKFTTDVIGSCAFGINMNALSDENSEFREVGKKMFTQTMRMQIRDICRQFLPNIYEIFGHLLQIPGVDQFLIDVVRDTIKYRRENKIVRPDFINTLMELQDHPEKLEDIELTDSLLTSQAFVFFAAGFETSSTTISHALYELALNQHIQDKLRKEIREVCDKHQGVLTYEAIKEMKYLDKFFKEVLRMYPLIPFVMREASENYTFKGTKVTIEKGTKLWVPAYGIQRDANIYPEPEKFDPERFNDDAVAARHPMAYLPFGDGPRNCIGSRFAQYQSKVGIIAIIRNHKVDVCEKTKIPYESDPRSFMLALKGGVHLKITKVEN